MKAILQRVKKCEVRVRGIETSHISQGLLVLLGVEKEDTEMELNYLLEKIIQLRIFEDDAGKMNLSLLEINDGSGGDMMVVSQFTILADTQRGRRPSFHQAGPPETSQALYNLFVEKARQRVKQVGTGVFGAHMDVNLPNDGPVTIVVESKRRLTVSESK